MNNVDKEMSILECLDVLNEELIGKGEEPIAFDHDCREGICGACGFVINGVAHGPERATTVCQLTMRHFSDGQELTIEPWRAGRVSAHQGSDCGSRAFDRIIASGGYISVSTGSAPDCEYDTRAEASGGPLDGRGSLHRLRRLRGGLSKRFRGTLYGREDHPSRTAAAR